MFPNSKHIRRQRGMSLIELLVAVAITVVLLSSILGVLLATMRTVARGNNIQKGYDLARGTYEVIEQDLSNAFASRDTGDHYKFFGTPIGMMFVGSAKGVVSHNAEGLARVTYVVHLNSTADEGNTVEIQSKTIDPNTGLASGEFIPVQTYSLVRYVETGVSDLDSYDFGNLGTWYDVVNNVENPNYPAVFREEFARAVDSAGFDISSYLYDPTAGGVTKEQAILIEAKKRELYIRMLAGDPALPHAFNEVVRAADGTITVIPGFLRDETGAGVNWLDYVVAENVAFTPQNIGLFQQPSLPNSLNFTSTEEREAAPWGVWPAFFAYGTRENVQNVSDQVALGNTAGASPKPVELKSPYWGATYNAYAQRFNGNNTRDNNLRNAIELVINQFNYDVYAARLGSPLNPRIPEIVSIRMGYKLESPFNGVTEFDQTFAQVIDVPTAYTRKRLAAPI